MSLAIDIDNVTAVLLADGWHTVANNSFELDAYEFVWNEETIHYGSSDGIVCSTGFGFNEDNGERICGPLSAVLAVRHRRRR